MTRIICTVLLLVAPSILRATPVTSLDNIQFWVGTGNNRAGLAIDWDDDSSIDESLVWGYRWDGTATGEDMLMSIASADSRLTVTTSQEGAAVFGLEYDDGSDYYYEEGWASGFWHYGVATGNAWPTTDWISSPLGMTERMLIDESWDSWAFNQPITFTAFSENPHAATLAATLGDYNWDGFVNEADYSFWLSNLGKFVSPVGSGADGDQSGIVDQGDFTTWKQQFDNTTTGSGHSSTVPEPGTWLITTVMFLALLCSLKKK